MQQVYIQDLAKHDEQIVQLNGWVANKRSGKGLVFLIVRDGTGFCQCVVDEAKLSTEFFEMAASLTMESSLKVQGKVVKDERQVGGYEIQVSNIEVLQIAEDYPIAKKEHGVDFLMDNRHLWLRSRRQWAIMRIRNKVIFAIHTFFQEKGFLLMDAPIFTGNACEGTSTLFETDFYGQPAYLSQSGQLYGEAMAMAFGRIYTFGPTFRAEKSKTRRHLSEFWMIEPEMAYYTNEMNMDLIEEFVRSVVTHVLQECQYELSMLERNTSMLENVKKTFTRIPYKEAVKILKGEQEVDGKNAIQVMEEDLQIILQSIELKEKEKAEREDVIKNGGIKQGVINFNQNAIDKLKVEIKEMQEKAGNIPQWIASAVNFQYGNDFGGSDETVITRLYDTPVMVYNWPKDIKAFYMKRCEDDPELVKGVDLLAPEGYGEIVGGAERETDKDILIERIRHEELPMEAFEWYLDLRRYGSVPHAGFGLGLERLITWICGIQHVREVIPFPRMYGRLFP